MINLIFNGTHPTASSYKLEYAKDDGINALVFTTVLPYPVSLPHTVENVADGKYVCRITPVKADNSFCEISQFTTTGCPDLLGFSVTYDSGTNNFICNVNLPVGVTLVNIKIDYPGGGGTNLNYTPISNVVTIAKPAMIEGEFVFIARSVCDAGENYYGTYTAPIVKTTVASVPCQVVTSLVVPSGQITEDTATVKWVGPVNQVGVVGYLVDWASADSSIIGSQLVAVGVEQYTITGLTPDLEYYWQVSVAYSDGLGGYIYCTKVSGPNFFTVEDSEPILP